MSSTTAATVKEYMAQAVKSGTGTKAQIKGYTVCGKTGTAEVSDDKSVPTNAWFIGFVDDVNHPYAVAVVVEQGGTGGATAAPLAAKALKRPLNWIFAKKRLVHNGIFAYNGYMWAFLGVCRKDRRATYGRHAIVWLGLVQGLTEFCQLAHRAICC